MQKIKSTTHEILETHIFDLNGPGKTPKGKPVLEREIFIFQANFK